MKTRAMHTVLLATALSTAWLPEAEAEERKPEPKPAADELQVRELKQKNDELRKEVKRLTSENSYLLPRWQAAERYPLPVRFTLQARYGGGLITSAVEVGDTHYVMNGWAPSAAAMAGFALSTVALVELELHWQAMPEGRVSRRDREIGDGSYYELAGSGHLKVLTGRGWYVQPGLGYAHGWFTLDLDRATGSTRIADVNQHGVALSLALGWDTLFDDWSAVGGALRLGYSHFFNDPDAAELTADVLAVTLEVGLSHY